MKQQTALSTRLTTTLTLLITIAIVIAPQMTQASSLPGDGDSSALHYETLQGFLPQSLDGYEALEPDGATLNMRGMSYSSASIEFHNAVGGHVKITLMDYRTASQLYQMATMAWTHGVSIDTPEEQAKGIKVTENIGGWQSFKKKSGEATVILGIGNRFLLTVEADNQESAEAALNIAKSMNLEKLAGM